LSSHLQACAPGSPSTPVSEILAVSETELTAAPELASEGTRIFDRIANIARDGRMILLIDPKALLDSAERDVLAACAKAASGT